MRTLLRRVRRQCARRWHSLVPFGWLLPSVTARRPNDEAGGGGATDSASSGKNNNINGTGTTIFGLRCLLAALLALPPFGLILFVTGLSDHFFETPFDQFRWSPAGVDVREQLLGPHVSITNLHHVQPAVPINPWPTLFARPLIEPSCRHTALARRNSVLIIVKSAPDRLQFRDAVRATYGSLKRYPPPAAAAVTGGGGGGAHGGADIGGVAIAGDGVFFRLRTVFVLGRPPPSPDADASVAVQLLDALEREAATHGDLLVGDFMDTYYNNTLKFVHSVRFARHYCAQLNPVPYVLLLDDDYLLFPWNLITELQRHVPNERLYMGWRHDTSPYRTIFSKWRVSLDEFPFDAFPPYIAGGAVLLTGQTVAEFYAAIPHTRLFRLDDIYTSIIAYLLAIHPQHSANFVIDRQSDAVVEQPSSPLVAVHDYSPAEMRKVYTNALQQKQRQQQQHLLS